LIKILEFIRWMIIIRLQFDRGVDL